MKANKIIKAIVSADKNTAREQVGIRKLLMYAPLGDQHLVGNWFDGAVDVEDDLEGCLYNVRRLKTLSAHSCDFGQLLEHVKNLRGRLAPCGAVWRRY